MFSLIFLLNIIKLILNEESWVRRKHGWYLKKAVLEFELGYIVSLFIETRIKIPNNSHLMSLGLKTRAIKLAIDPIRVIKVKRYHKSGWIK